MRRHTGLGTAWLLLFSAATLASCYTGPGPDHFVAILDELVTPADWQVVETVTRGPNEARQCDPALSTTCPTAIRWFTVTGGLVPAYDKALDVVTSAGFKVSEESPQSCADEVSTGSFCGFWADRGPETLMVSLFHALSETEAEAGDQNAPAVAVAAYRDPD